MISTVLALLPNEPYGNIALLSSNENLHNELQKHVDMTQGKLFNLSTYNLKRLPYGGEFFDAFIVDEDSFFTMTKPYKSLEKALQKNRILIVVSDTLHQEFLQEELTPFGFSDFSTIDNIIVAKKWFKL